MGINLLNDAEAVGIITMEHIRTHESKDGHDVAEHCIGSKTRKRCHEEQGLIECLRIFGH